MLIGDASVIIDFESAELLAVIRDLEDVVVVPDLLFEDELSADLGPAERQPFRIEQMSAIEVAEADAAAAGPGGTSIYDQLALILARRVGGILLTGDQALKRAAEAVDLEVHGTIWVVERMVGAGLLDLRAAGDAYRRMVDAGGHLPLQDALDRLDTFSATGRFDPVA